MYAIFVTLLKFQLDKSNTVNPEHPSNALFISSRDEVTKFPTDKVVRAEQPLNISAIVTTLVVSISPNIIFVKL